jgi:succinate-semialdehyde dehydrogenase / glutarate-semialdehyde dehydrogenase
MTIATVNPANGKTIRTFEPLSEATLEARLQCAADTFRRFRRTPLTERIRMLQKAAEILETEKEELGRLMVTEMGKTLKAATEEAAKCAWGCRYYVENAARLLADEVVETSATRSFITYQPIGPILAIMPWNFPFWQLFRFAAPALVAGNTVLLKHASNVPQCALAIERVLAEAGCPEGVFRTLLVSGNTAGKIIGDRRVHAVTVTGSEETGRKVAALAGQHLKKTVLELGGSDAFVVLADADRDKTVKKAVQSRFQNAGQSCIAAKRFIVEETISAEFIERFRELIEALKPGDPMDAATTLAPLARADLRDELHAQVEDALARNAVGVTGCRPLDRPGAYYAPSILEDVAPGMRAWQEELFGPVASIIRARDVDHAVEVANASHYGLGGSVWTEDEEKGEAVARRLQCGAAFVNELVKSDPRLPFGGVKDSGYGRELARHGIHEFVNIKTLWVQ